MTKIDPRHYWATSILSVQPDEQVLEIGCGAGITANLVADSLDKGHLHAIDRSAAMVEMAKKRNVCLIESGKLSLACGKFSRTILPETAFDKVYAFNLRTFLTQYSTDSELVRKLLKPGGKFFVFYQPMGPSDGLMSDGKEGLRHAGFEIIDSLVQPGSPLPSFCIIAAA